uniref:SD10988p n=1 Tax=Drosophila melanogaster TaxID=7227 RepID=Q95ST7_DROME|nr:SD10988p [Drosophila melanogaster]
MGSSNRRHSKKMAHPINGQKRKELILKKKRPICVCPKFFRKSGKRWHGVHGKVAVEWEIAATRFCLGLLGWDL